MATKPTTSLKDKRISPSPTLPSPKILLSRGDSTSPSEAKKPTPNYLKSKVVFSFESPTRRIPVVNAITASATTKTSSARRLADKPPSLSTLALQRPLKPAAYTPKRSSSSMLHVDKAAQTVSRTARTNLFPKAKSTRPTLLRKKEAAPVTIAATSEVKVSSDHDAVTAFEWPVKEQLWNNHKKVVKALNELKIMEESRFISSLIEEVDHIEEQKSGEPENWGEVLVPLVFDEIPKEPVVLEEVPKQAGVVFASTSVEKRDEEEKLEQEVEKRDEEEKLEQEDVVVRRVDLEARKPMLGATVTTVVTPMPTVKKKDTPLSNDVIEENKSKLMGTRKNKVLALVGAFEMVISLQEPEGQHIQKVLQVQHGLQFQQDQQAEKSFENHKNELGVENE